MKETGCDLEIFLTSGHRKGHIKEKKMISGWKKIVFSQNTYELWKTHFKVLVSSGSNWNLGDNFLIIKLLWGHKHYKTFQNRKWSLFLNSSRK